MEQFIARAVENTAGPGYLVSIFGLFALTLSMIGVYGQMSYNVSQRRHEFGVRMALGARREEVLGSVLQRGLRITIAGLAIGLAAAAGVAHALQGFLFEVSPLDWRAFGGASLLLLAAAGAACYVPARLAAGVDPARALRYE